MSIESVHQLLNAWKMPRLSTGNHVFELSRNTWLPLIHAARLHDRQIEVLRIVRALPWNVYLDYDESPEDWELVGHWIHEGENTWIVPREQTSEILLDGYLAPGGWSMYISSYPLVGSRIPGMFESSPEEICEFVRNHSIPILVQAHLDNSEWRIVIEPAVVPVTNAA